MPDGAGPDGAGRRPARRLSAGRGRIGRRPGPPEPPEQPRASIWSVPEAHRRLYFGLFALLFPAGLGWNFWYAISGGPPSAGWRGVTQAILESLPTTGIGAALIAFFISELWRFAMVLGDWLEEKLKLKELKAQRAAEREKTRAAREAELKAEVEEKVREAVDRARTETPEEARKRMGNRAYNRMQREIYERAAERIIEEEIQGMSREEILREYLRLGNGRQGNGRPSDQK